MANQTIYPYGTGGSLPEGYPIVNDLVTGGADKALSAEMGKELAPVTDIIEDVTVPAKTTSHRLNTAGRYNGNYYTAASTGAFDTTINSNANWVSGYVEVSEGDTVTIIGNKGGADYRIYTIVNASGNRIEVGPTTSTTYTSSSPLTVTIPANAARIYINMQINVVGYTIQKTVQSYETRALMKATTTNDGIMTKEQVAQLESVADEDGDLAILKSYIEDSEDVENIEFVTGKYYKNYNLVNYTGQNYVYDGDNNDLTTDANWACAKVPVNAGDTLTIWCSVNNVGIPYVICDKNNILKTCSPKSTTATAYTYTREEPAVVQITEEGYVYVDAMLNAAYGCIKNTPKRAFRNATTEEDGLMPKEIMALFGGGSMSDDQTSLKLKTFAFIGDSFSAGGYWQNIMCNDLGALLSSNKAVSGGAWYGTDSLSAYYQAGKLIETGSQYDYILCVLGTNDVAHWSTYTLGDIVNSETIGTASGNVNPSGSITGGIQATLIRLKNAFPNAIIKIGYTPAGHIHDNYSSIPDADALCNRLKELSFIYGVGYIETRDCGINPYMAYDLDTYVGKNQGQPTGHPSEAGYIRIAHYMARKMLCNL